MCKAISLCPAQEFCRHLHGSYHGEEQEAVPEPFGETMELCLSSLCPGLLLIRMGKPGLAS